MCSDTPMVSVIVPAYNAAATVGSAVRSVLDQDFHDFEIIVVNDGSADETASAALQAFTHAPKGFDPRRLKLVGHSGNRGSAAAWQSGLDAAAGRYVTKLDADDTLPQGALRALAGAAADSGAAVVRGQYNRVENGRPAKFGPDARRVGLNDSPVSVDYFSLCGKLIDRTMLADADMRAWPRLDRWEDLGVVARVMALEPLVTTIDAAVYNYNIAPRGASLSTSARSRLLADHLAVARNVERWMESHGVADANGEFLAHLKFAAKVKLLRGRGRDVERWKSTFPEVNGRVMSLRHVPARYRLLFAAVAALPTRLVQGVSDIVDKVL